MLTFPLELSPEDGCNQILMPMQVEKRLETLYGEISICFTYCIYITREKQCVLWLDS